MLDLRSKQEVRPPETPPHYHHPPAHPSSASSEVLTSCSSPFRRCSYSRICRRCFRAVSTLGMGTQSIRPWSSSSPTSTMQGKAFQGASLLPALGTPQTAPLALDLANLPLGPCTHFCDVRFSRSESLSRLSRARASKKFSFCTDSQVNSFCSSSLDMWSAGGGVRTVRATPPI